MNENKMLILLNDRDPVLTRISKMKYERESGWTVLIPSTFDEALKVYEDQKPDAVVTEIVLNDSEGRSGFDFITAIGKSSVQKKPQIVILTDLSQEDDKQRAKELGVEHYFVKSQVSLKDFIAELVKILG